MIIRKHLEYAGRKVLKTNPDYFHQLISDHDFDATLPSTEDLTNHFNRICTSDITEANDYKKVFIAAVIAVYTPNVLSSKHFHGYGPLFAHVLGTSRQTANYNIKKALTYYKHYDDFKDKVDQAVKIIQDVRT